MLAIPTSARAQEQAAQAPSSALEDPLRVLTPAEQTFLCGQAAALAERYPDDAQALEKKLLGRADCSPEALKEVEQQTEPDAVFAEKLAVIRGLQREGFDEEARKQLQALVAEYPARDIPENLREPDQRIGFWRRFLGAVGPVVRVAAEILAAFLALFGILILLPYVIRRLVARWSKQVELTGFEPGGDSSLGPSLTSALQDQFARLEEDRQSDGVKWVSAADGKFDLPDAVAKVFRQASLIAGLFTALDSLLPRRLVRVSGTVRPVDPTLGAGLTLGLSDRRGRGLAQATVWEASFGLLGTGDAAQPDVGDDDSLGSRYDRLLVPGATWLAYRPELDFDPEAPPLGTTDWRSYARFAVAELALRGGRLDEARLGCFEALDRDGANLGAKLNLGALLLHPDADGPEEDDAAARVRLERASALLAQVQAASEGPSEALWYRSRYLLGVARLYGADLNPPPDQLPPAHGTPPDDVPGDGGGCQSLEARALENFDAVLRGITGQRGQDPNLDPLLRALELPVKVSRQSALVLAGHDPDTSFLTGRWCSAATEYNLACLYARWSTKGDPNQAVFRRKQALTHLREALRRLRPGGGRVSARADPALKPLHVLKGWHELVCEPQGPAEPKDEDDPVAELVELVRGWLTGRTGEREGPASP